MRIAALAFGILAGIAASLLLAFGALDVPPGTGPADRGAQAIRFGLFLIGNAGIFGAALALWAPLGAAITLGIGAIGWLAAILITGRATDFVLYAPPVLLVLGAILALVAHLRRPRDEADVEILRPLRATHAEPTSEAGGFVYEDDHDDEDDEREPEMEMPHFGTPPRNAAARESARAHEFFAADPDDEWDPRRKRSVPPRARADFREPDEEDEYEDEPSFFSRLALGTSGVLSFALYAAIAVVAVLVIWNWRTGANTQPPATEIAAAPAPVVAEPVAPAPAAPAPAAPAAPALAPEPAAQLPAPATTTSAAPALTPAPAAAEAPQPAAEAPAMRTIDAPPSTSTPAVTIVPEAPAAPAEPAAPAPTSTTEPPPPTQAATIAAPGQPLPLLMPASMAALRQMPAPPPADAPPPAPAAALSLPAPVDTGL